MTLYRCSHCGKMHALLYYKEPDGSVKLSYFCNRFLVMSKTRNGDVVQKHHLKRFDIPFQEGLGIPTIWAPGSARDNHMKQQLQMLLMHSKPHEDARPDERKVHPDE